VEIVGTIFLTRRWLSPRTERSSRLELWMWLPRPRYCSKIYARSCKLRPRRPKTTSSKPHIRFNRRPLRLLRRPNRPFRMLGREFKKLQLRQQTRPRRWRRTQVRKSKKLLQRRLIKQVNSSISLAKRFRKLQLIRPTRQKKLRHKLVKRSKKPLKRLLWRQKNSHKK